MSSFRFLYLCLALLLCLQSVSAVPHHAVRRQDDNRPEQSQAPLSSTIRSSRPSASIVSSGDLSSFKTDKPSPTADSSIKPSNVAATATATAVIPSTDASTSTVPGPTSSAGSDPTNPLPIRPKVTPAMGLTGALLLITGLVYAVIGIKNKWVYVSGSAAYLTALAVTVLIVYLMNSPVSDGVQAAFFVAAFVTGVIFGVLSLVFSDITEGFGCLLGGFCLSMWFLSLKSGGLIESTTGRAIFIGCMSAGGYSLSFSRYTRNYSLIASISFSGATATMLGIDCLTRAGWKEFWLYLWNLNDNIFPLNTNTYPLTKNIKAELAAVIIITIFGAVSQLRVWKLVKEHRAKSAAQELEQQQEKDQEEEARGRSVEDSFQKEREQWEAAYGNKSNPDSSIRSSSITSPKGSTSIREKEVYTTDSVEMTNLSKSGVVAAGSTVTVSVLRDDAIQQIDAQGNPITHVTTGSRNTNKTLPNAPDNTLPLADKPSATKRASLRSTVPPPPPVVPLPFNVPSGEVPGDSDEDSASVSAVPETHDEARGDLRPMSKRIIDMSATKRFSTNRISQAFSESSEALVPYAHIEDDRASSVAATLDDDRDDISLHQLSPTQSPIGTEHNFAKEDAETKGVNKVTADDDSTMSRQSYRQSLTTSTDPKPNNARKNRSPTRDSRIRADTLVSGSKSASELAKSDALSQDSQAERPERLSKVALSYRTNEWAKHLEAAERPDLDELSMPSSPNIIPEEGPVENAAPVSDEIASPLMGSKSSSRRVSVESKANKNSGLGLNRPASTFSQKSSLDQRSITRPQPTASPAVLSRSNSGAQLDALTPLPSNTLMGQRENLMRKRTSNQSFTPNSSVGNLLEQADQENLSLAQRRQMLQHHQAPTQGLQHQTSLTSQRKAPPSTSQKWQQKGWATKGAPVGFDSHQPQRTLSSQSNQRREELFAGWRNNIQDVSSPQTQAQVVEQQRLALINERRQKEAEKAQREAVQQQRASVLDNMMRSGHMLDAHREAMRKMQANADRHAS
ncbi:hypothetical protein GQ44DRAFT_727511 [Phaeosphaeriaceae sp. PMI808]|nr:hypothetical protein GQ44DRAFT_727511 [Phaeosphaeriaceae sp. PMI808]